VIVVAVAALITIGLALRNQTARRFLAGQLVDPNLDQFNRSTLFTGDPTGVSKWTRASVAHRIAVRYAFIILPFLLTISALTHRTATIALCITGMALIAAGFGWNLWQWIRTRDYRRNVRDPLYYGLLQVVGWPDGTKPGDVIIAGKNYHKNGVNAKLPPEFQRLDPVLENASVIASRTLGGNWEANWDLVGQPTVHLRHAPEPPDEVVWNE
jgi:hypothetical protein